MTTESISNFSPPLQHSHRLVLLPPHRTQYTIHPVFCDLFFSTYQSDWSSFQTIQKKIVQLQELHRLILISLRNFARADTPIQRPSGNPSSTGSQTFVWSVREHDSLKTRGGIAWIYETSTREGVRRISIRHCTSRDIQGVYRLRWQRFPRTRMGGVTALIGSTTAKDMHGNSVRHCMPRYANCDRIDLIESQNGLIATSAPLYFERS